MSQMGSGTLIHALMISSLDYGNSLPPGLLQASQWKKKRELVQQKCATPEIFSLQSLIHIYLCLEVLGLAAS